MFSRRQFTSLVVALLLCSVKPFAQTDKDSEMKAFADGIYRLWDQGKYAEMYRHFHSTMKAQATEEQWVTVARGVAQKTGRNLERRFKEAQPAFGQRMLRYESRYEGGRANDDIYIIEENGHLTVSGIWVRPVL